MRDVHDELVRADAVEPRHFVRWKFLAGYLQAPAGMREADDGPLRFGPAEDRQVPGGPVLDAFGSGVILLFQIQQDDVTRVAGGEAGDLEIVMHQLARFGKRVVLSRE